MIHPSNKRTAIEQWEVGSQHFIEPTFLSRFEVRGDCFAWNAHAIINIHTLTLQCEHRHVSRRRSDTERRSSNSV